jgi:ABC-type Mn2+/Zn2+ transport system permease subunit
MCRAFRLAFALTIALGLHYLGVLLMGSLVIIPAAIAAQLARRLDDMLLNAVGVAGLSTVLGVYAGTLLHRETGPLIITAGRTGFYLLARFLASDSMQRVTRAVQPV